VELVASVAGLKIASGLRKSRASISKKVKSIGLEVDDCVNFKRTTTS
jgi:biotin operon repressor